MMCTRLAYLKARYIARGFSLSTSANVELKDRSQFPSLGYYDDDGDLTFKTGPCLRRQERGVRLGGIRSGIFRLKVQIFY